MILSTMNDLPGYEVTEVIGEVFGITVRSRNIGSSLGAAFKSLAGGELRGMTKLLSASRTEAQDRLIETAQAKGADAILAITNTRGREKTVREAFGEEAIECKFCFMIRPAQAQ